jgi:hypothetical protein
MKGPSLDSGIDVECFDVAVKEETDKDGQMSSWSSEISPGGSTSDATRVCPNSQPDSFGPQKPKKQRGRPAKNRNFANEVTQPSHLGGLLPKIESVASLHPNFAKKRGRPCKTPEAKNFH